MKSETNPQSKPALNIQDFLHFVSTINHWSFFKQFQPVKKIFSDIFYLASLPYHFFLFSFALPLCVFTRAASYFWALYHGVLVVIFRAIIEYKKGHPLGQPFLNFLTRFLSPVF